MKKKKSMSLIVSAILGILYGTYLIIYFGSSLSGNSSGADAIGGALATALVTPHILFIVLAVIFNVIAVFNYKRGFALTGAILYTSAAIIFLFYGIFVIPMIILSFVGYVRLKAINLHNASMMKQKIL